MTRPHLNPLPQGEEAGFAAGEGSKHLFGTLDVYHDESTRSAALNMAIDEALLEAAVVPSVRFYQWNHPALSFGYFGQFQDVANHQRDIVRRWTGGGIVFHGEDLTYSIVIPASDVAFGRSSMSIYEKAHAAIRKALTANGQLAELAGASTFNLDSRSPDRSVASPSDQCSPSGGFPARRIQPSTFEGQCFANPVNADVMLNGRKVAGAAQRRTRRGLLQQGSIQDVDIGNGLSDSFANALCDNCRTKRLDAALLARAEEIAAQRYGTSAWLHRR